MDGQAWKGKYYCSLKNSNMGATQITIINR